MALARGFSQQVVRSFAPACGFMTSAAIRAPSAALAPAAAPTQAESTLQGLLGLSAAQVRAMLASQPDIGAVRPSVLLERVQFLACGLGISSTRLRSLVVEKPALLSDLSVKELRSMAGLGSE